MNLNADTWGGRPGDPHEPDSEIHRRSIPDKSSREYLADPPLNSESAGFYISSAMGESFIPAIGLVFPGEVPIEIQIVKRMWGTSLI